MNAAYHVTIATLSPRVPLLQARRRASTRVSARYGSVQGGARTRVGIFLLTSSLLPPPPLPLFPFPVCWLGAQVRPELADVMSAQAIAFYYLFSFNDVNMAHLWIPPFAFPCGQGWSQARPARRLLKSAANLAR